MAATKSRKRKPSGGQTSKSSFSEPSRRERRKMSRKEERREKKRLKNLKLKGKSGSSQRITGLGTAPSTYAEEVEQKTRESFSRKQEMKNRLHLSQIRRAIDKHRDRIENWVPEKPADPLPRDKRYKLKGAARPAEEVYPHLYPPKEVITEQPKNLFEVYNGDLSMHEETFEFIKLKFLLGSVQLSQGLVEDSIQTLNEVKQHNGSEGLFCDLVQEYEVAAYIESGSLAQAREIAESILQKNKDIFLLWDMVLIEYISFYLLNEDNDNGESVKACILEAYKACPEIAEVLIANEEFEEDISPEAIIEDNQAAFNRYCEDCKTYLSRDKQDAKPKLQYSTSTEARYFHRSISWWRDADGVFDKLAELLPQD
mmetsp:Transcript_13705/g.15609  ORF Transcript_13705/g.15609 Transcript_13705/m.15609 type:complete len:370 (+) Transcript_13705:140-1249(+)